MLYREPSVTTGEMAIQGLRRCSASSYFASAYNNDFSFYAQGDINLRGLLPGRDEDQLMAGAAVGQGISYDDYCLRRDADRGPSPTEVLSRRLPVPFQRLVFRAPYVQYLSIPTAPMQSPMPRFWVLSLGVDF